MNFVSINSEINRMDTGNITKVVGPNLVYPRVPKDPFETMSDVTKLNDILTIITTNFSYFFEQDVDLFELENLTVNNVIIIPLLILFFSFIFIPIIYGIPFAYIFH